MDEEFISMDSLLEVSISEGCPDTLNIPDESTVSVENASTPVRASEKNTLCEVKSPESKGLMQTSDSLRPTNSPQRLMQNGQGLSSESPKPQGVRKMSLDSQGLAKAVALSERLAKNNQNATQVSLEEQEYYKTMFSDFSEVRYLRVHCTVCERHLGCSAVAPVFSHRILRVMVCLNCYIFYEGGDFDRGEDGSDLYCRWCGQGGKLLCCSSCPNVFCEKCVKINFGMETLRSIKKVDDWDCFVCNLKTLWEKRAICNALINYINLLRSKAKEVKLRTNVMPQNVDESECCKPQPDTFSKTKSAPKKTPVSKTNSLTTTSKPVNAPKAKITTLKDTSPSTSAIAKTTSLFLKPPNHGGFSQKNSLVVKMNDGTSYIVKRPNAKYSYTVSPNSGTVPTSQHTNSTVSSPSTNLFKSPQLKNCHSLPGLTPRTYLRYNQPMSKAADPANSVCPPPRLTYTTGISQGISKNLTTPSNTAGQLRVSEDITQNGRVIGHKLNESLPSLSYYISKAIGTNKSPLRNTLNYTPHSQTNAMYSEANSLQKHPPQPPLSTDLSSHTTSTSQIYSVAKPSDSGRTIYCKSGVNLAYYRPNPPPLIRVPKLPKPHGSPSLAPNRVYTVPDSSPIQYVDDIKTTPNNVYAVDDSSSKQYLDDTQVTTTHNIRDESILTTSPSVSFLMTNHHLNTLLERNPLIEHQTQVKCEWFNQGMCNITELSNMVLARAHSLKRSFAETESHNDVAGMRTIAGKLHKMLQKVLDKLFQIDEDIGREFCDWNNSFGKDSMQKSSTQVGQTEVIDITDDEDIILDEVTGQIVLNAPNLNNNRSNVSLISSSDIEIISEVGVSKEEHNTAVPLKDPLTSAAVDPLDITPQVSISDSVQEGDPLENTSPISNVGAPGEFPADDLEQQVSKKIISDSNKEDSLSTIEAKDNPLQSSTETDSDIELKAEDVPASVFLDLDISCESDTEEETTPCEDSDLLVTVAPKDKQIEEEMDVWAAANCESDDSLDILIDSIKTTALKKKRCQNSFSVVNLKDIIAEPSCSQNKASQPSLLQQTLEQSQSSLVKQTFENNKQDTFKNCCFDQKGTQTVTKICHMAIQTEFKEENDATKPQHPWSHAFDKFLTQHLKTSNDNSATIMQSTIQDPDKEATLKSFQAFLNKSSVAPFSQLNSTSATSGREEIKKKLNLTNTTPKPTVKDGSIISESPTKGTLNMQNSSDIRVCKVVLQRNINNVGPSQALKRKTLDISDNQAKRRKTEMPSTNLTPKLSSLAIPLTRCKAPFVKAHENIKPCFIKLEKVDPTKYGVLTAMKKEN
uniref:PHD-type domain-containing protein n=1 Tax=Timema bartmani TaxID=61472 RepID=A0A7R9HXZ5_9NEOP|nr:unnamed protein product [Timema bartmani]